MIIDCVADLHGFLPKLEGGDLLIVAGDLTARDTPEEHILFQIWLHDQNYKNKVVVAGNHDNRLHKLPFQGIKRQYEEMGETYLCDSGTEFSYHIDGLPEQDEGFLPSGKRTLKIWGSPWTQRFEGMNPHCMAFTVDTDEELAEKWALIPPDTNILITHSPSFGNYDWIKTEDENIGPSVGSITLWMYMLTMVPHLKLHVTGHIHEAYGNSVHANGIHLVNASYVNERYKPVNKPIRIIL